MAESRPLKTFLYRGVPVLGFSAYSGSGKTTLIRKLIPKLIERGKRPAIIKRTHHAFDVDYPGKDSYELRKAGANQILVGSGKRWAMVVETPSNDEPQLAGFLHKIDVVATDVILVEGFREVQFPKIEVHRSKLQKPLFYPHDPCVIAIVTDVVERHKRHLLTIEIDHPADVADLIVDYCTTALYA